MLFLLSYTFSLVLMSTIVSCESTMDAQTTEATQPFLPPKKDPWYTAPANLTNAQPGSILRIRPAPGNITASIGDCSTAYNILFRTTNSNSKAAFAVTTVLLPKAHDTSGGASLLSYQIPYNTADVDGSPSFLLSNSTADSTDISAALRQGWVVSVPDFEGPLASFLMGLTEGRAVLDSIRAVLSHTEFSLSVNSTRVALWGYSGGSIASAFAVELQAQYAPELRVHGAAIGGTVPNFGTTVPIVNSSPQAGLMPAAFLGLTSQSDSARKLLTSQLHPNNASQFLKALGLPLTQLQPTFEGIDVTSYFVNYSSFIFAPEVQSIRRDNWHLGYHGVPQVPIFMYKAIEDQVAPVAEVDDLVHRWCMLENVDIRYERNKVGGHEAEYFNGAPRALDFLASVFNGKNTVVPIGRGCITQDVSVGKDVSPF